MTTTTTTRRRVRLRLRLQEECGRDTRKKIDEERRSSMAASEGRKINMNAGPGPLPEAVLRQAQEEMLNWNGVGCSIMEMSHRSKEYEALIAEARLNLISLLQVPSNYRVLFLQGGGTGQFAAVPLNLILPDKRGADYIVTGSWSKAAAVEAKKFCDVNVVIDTMDASTKKYTRLPSREEYEGKLNPDAAYVYYCANETVNGVEFPDDLSVWGATHSVPIVVDVSSNILSRPLDVSRFAVVYAGAQKNMGPAGVTVVIVREDMLGHPQSICPVFLDYTVMAANDSMYNTPPTYGVYVLGLVLKWVIEEGGVAAISERTARKAAALYGAIDNSNGFYRGFADVAARSRMNVTFTLADSGLEAQFLKVAEERGIMGIKGHRSAGGMRASLYNAVTEDQVASLIAFMEDFRAIHTK